SNSSKGGGGFNEIRFEDKKGEEQIFVHGEKDLDIRIKNDRREWIGRDRHLIVKCDLLAAIDHDHHLTIKANEAIAVTGSQSFAVKGNGAEEFQANHSEQVTNSYYLKAMNVVIEGMTGLTIQVGASFITLSPAGIQIVGPMVLINSGGAALPGVPGVLVPPLPPAAAEIADNADPGSKDMTYKTQRAAMSSSQQAAANAPSHDPHADDNSQKKSWIGIKLEDDEGKPVPGEKYRITLPDGTTLAEGTLDETGSARVAGIDPGSCKVTFPELDKWEPK